jgi:hypothetical protein
MRTTPVKIEMKDILSRGSRQFCCGFGTNVRIERGEQSHVLRLSISHDGFVDLGLNLSQCISGVQLLISPFRKSGRVKRALNLAPPVKSQPGNLSVECLRENGAALYRENHTMSPYE